MATSDRPDNPTFAIGVIITVVLAMSIGDSIIKASGADSSIGLWQLFIVRSAILIPILLAAWVYVRSRSAVVPLSPAWVGIRSVLLVLVWVLYYAALPNLPFAAAAASLYTLPLFIAAFSAIWTEDRVTVLHAVAAVVGFAGVALILRPGGDAFSAYALLPIGAAALFAASVIVTRLHCRNEHPLALTFWLHIAFIAAGVLGLIALAATGEGSGGVGFLSAGWQPMDAQEWQRMAVLAVMILIASVGTAIAYQRAPSSVLGTYEFAYVGFATLWGLLFFQEQIDLVSGIGLALIVVAGVLAARRRAQTQG